MKKALRLKRLFLFCRDFESAGPVLFHARIVVFVNEFHYTRDDLIAETRAVKHAVMTNARLDIVELHVGWQI